MRTQTGPTNLFVTESGGQSASQTRQGMMSLILIGTGAPGASVNVETTTFFANPPQGIFTWQSSTISGTVALATNAANTIEFTTQFGSNPANTHSIRLMSLIVEELN
jgi:hypothetical protein